MLVPVSSTNVQTCGKFLSAWISVTMAPLPCFKSNFEVALTVTIFNALKKISQTVGAWISL